MEISQNTKNKENKNFQILTLIGLSLLLLLVIYTIYLFEKYILFSPIYYILKTIFDVLNINLENFLNIISILIIVIFQIIILKIIILSIIFPSGGLFSRFFIYKNFVIFVNEQRSLVQKSIDCLTFPICDFTKNDLVKSMSYINAFQTVYNSFKMTDNSTFEIKQFQFGDYLNEIIYEYNKYKEDNYQSNEIKNSIINNLKSYRKILYEYTNFSFIDIYIKFNHKKFIEIIRELAKNSFNEKSFNYAKITNNFGIYLISPKINNSEIKTLVIYCGPNACSAEWLLFYKDNIKLYLDIKEITLMIWNYKGYGLRPGFTSFNSIDKDLEIIKKYIIKNYNYYRIIIHGLSIGGYPAIKLAKILNEKKVCLIADRTYADIDLIANTFIKKGKIIYNILFPKFLNNSDNVQNYIDIPIGNKIILFDEKDNIIDYSQGSLINNLTKKYYNEIILPKISKYSQYKSLINYISGDYKNLRIELKRIKNFYNKDLDEKTTIFINNLNININNLGNFLIYFLIFGYPFNLFKEINYDKTFLSKNYIELPEKLRDINEKYKNKFSQNLIDLISKLNFLFIKSNLIISASDEDIISFSYNNYNNDFNLQENVQDNLLKYFGYVHRIFCNHNQPLEDIDEKYLIKYFELNQFISNKSKEKSIENRI